MAQSNSSVKARDTSPKEMNPIFRVFVALGLAGFSLMAGCTRESEPIDPWREIVKLTVGGTDLDIPLGYFFHKTVWNGGRWPKPKERRTQVDSVRLYAYLDGINPWTPETNGSFAGLASPDITLIIIGSRYASSDWLNKRLEPRIPTLRQVKVHDSAEGMLAFESDYNANETIFLDQIPPEKPFTVITCVKRPGGGCQVKFDYKDKFIVEYSLQRGQVHRWKSVHADMHRFLGSL